MADARPGLALRGGLKGGTMAPTTKMVYRGYIQEKYPELVREYTRTMCSKCGFAALGFEGCDKDILPVTLDGAPCPYFIQRQLGGRKDPYRVLLGRR